MARALAERDLGAVIAIFRQRTGASQTDVGMLVGLPQPHISGIEHGKRVVTSLDLFERFAERLGIPRHLLGLADTSGGHSNVAGSAGLNYRTRETDETVLASHRQWLETRHKLGRHRARLSKIASNLYPPSTRLDSTGTLMPESWRLRAPVDLTSVSLSWQDNASAPVITGQHSETIPLRPLVAPGQRYSRYHRAMRDLDRPRLFENRLCYRLLNVDPGDARGGRVTLDLTLGNMCYFDMIDVGEALAHELAMVAIDPQDRIRNPEHDGDGPPIDYENEEPFRSLDAARRAGKIRIFCLGVGIDALNYVGDVLTVAVFDADVFDDIFDGMVTQNDEGELATGPDRQEFTFDRPTIEHLLATEPFAPSGAACLHLALEHHESLV
jgi:transcriptional regulator with XRE-family HTH domain